MMKKRNIFQTALLFLLSLTFLFGAASCSAKDETEDLKEKIAALQLQAAENAALIESLKAEAKENEAKIEDLEAELEKYDPNLYDFYITFGSMPTTYATLNAYAQKNPNTYMWFLRGNSISYENSDATIRYFETQSATNENSEVDYAVIREQVSSILKKNPDAKFHLYCDDIRVRLIPDIFVAAGVDFEDLDVTLLSDSTASYTNFSKLTDAVFTAQPKEWERILQEYEEGRGDPAFESPYPQDGQAKEMKDLSFFLSTYDNVELWIQNPEYLINRSTLLMASKTSDMHIVKKDPRDMYNALDEKTREAYQKAVLANALEGSDTLLTLEDAAEYFDTELSGRDKDVVLILGTNKLSLADNKFYIDATLAYYTPTRDPFNATKVHYKGKTYTVDESATTLTVDERELEIGKIGVYLFFKEYPNYPSQQNLLDYFEANDITVLPQGTPFETIFWMYDVKCGGYQSTAYLLTRKGQTEFFYEEPKSEALVRMKDVGFFDGATAFISGK